MTTNPTTTQLRGASWLPGLGGSAVLPDSITFKRVDSASWLHDLGGSALSPHAQDTHARPALLRDIGLCRPEDRDTLSNVSPSRRRLVTSWHEEEGMEGMKEAFETVRQEAHNIDNRIDFTAPKVWRLRDDDEELVFVSSSILVPKDMDRMAFRDVYFDRIAEVLRPADLLRLALGVRPLEPAV